MGESQIHSTRKCMNKINKLLAETKLQRQNFGFKYSSSFFMAKLLKFKKFKTRKLAIKLLDKEFGYIFQKLSKKEYKPAAQLNKNIFVYWANGFNDLPPIVDLCLKNLKTYFFDYDIHLVDDKNLSKYIQLDQNILTLYKSSFITVQTFSDIIRFNLLYKYGGIWCDATLLFLEKLPLDSILQNYGFYSLNFKSCEKEKLWGKVYQITWSTFFLVSDKNNPNMEACVTFYNNYYKKHNYAIDYFMNDYMLILCSKYKSGNNQLAKIPSIDGHPFLITQWLYNDKIDLSVVKKIPQKLNWRLTKKEYERILCLIRQI